MNLTPVRTTLPAASWGERGSDRDGSFQNAWVECHECVAGCVLARLVARVNVQRHILKLHLPLAHGVEHGLLLAPVLGPLIYAEDVRVVAHERRLPDAGERDDDE
eukprot:CAMPEP_0115838082 /NCGR_PEP_ID=MMETSP0287-20121206/5545_1 /TAXON_ID=412157 /ORGANISM="Chrysochromulina rotalis, Strain UIO044" /LENGTH=104 /DNA_ID=CAMNT_0003291597 /DNA_START=85 /DNA_END=399 /DNA_ORIENTATION=+